MLTDTKHFGIAVFAWLLLFADTARASSFSVDDWTLLTAILDNSGGEPVTTGASFTEVENPFMDAHGGSLPPPSASTTVASYICAWNELSGMGSFDIATSQSLESVGEGSAFVVTSGTILMTPGVDIVLEIDAQYSYQLPVDPMYARLGVAVTNVDTLVDLYGEAESYDTIFGSPAGGTFDIAGQVVLPAGQTWALQYSMRTITFAGPTGFVATGEGSMHFSLQPVPEPATLFLLPWAALGWRGVRKRRHTNQ